MAVWAKIETFTAISRKVVGKNVHLTIPKGNMGYDQYTVPDTVAVKTSFVAFLQHAQTYVHFFEEQRTQNHPRALFPTTFLEIAV